MPEKTRHSAKGYHMFVSFAELLYLCTLLARDAFLDMYTECPRIPELVVQAGKE